MWEKATVSEIENWLSADVDLEATTVYEATHLMSALKVNHDHEAIGKLVDAGANLNARDIWWSDSFNDCSTGI